MPARATLLGGAVGILLAQWALAAVVSLGADLIPRVADVRLDPLALMFALHQAQVSPAGELLSLILTIGAGVLAGPSGLAVIRTS